MIVACGRTTLLFNSFTKKAENWVKKSVIADVNNLFNNLSSISCVPVFFLSKIGLWSGVVNGVVICSKYKKRGVNDAVVNSDWPSQQQSTLSVHPFIDRDRMSLG